MKAAPQDVRGSRGDVAEAPAGVAFVCHPYHRGGVTRWMIDAAAEFRRRGTAVWFVAPEPIRPFPSGARRPTMASAIRAQPIAARPTLLAPRVDFRFELGTQAYRADVYAGEIACGIPAGTPVIVSDDEAVWAGATLVGASHPVVGVLHSDESKYYAMADRYRDHIVAFVSVSQRVARAAHRKAGVDSVVIPCGVPMRDEAGASAPAHEQARLIWIGRTDEEQKRVSDLPKIADALRTRGLAFRLAIVGDGPEQRSLARSIRELNLDREVQLLGWKDADEIWELLRGSDVLLLPSNFEGMPVVVMEALAAGCAVVASRVSGIEDIDEEAFTGRPLATHDVGDIESAASLVMRALRVPAAERRRAARHMAEALFSIGTCVDRYVELLRTMAVANAPRARPRRRVSQTLVSTPVACARAAKRALLSLGTSA